MGEARLTVSLHEQGVYVAQEQSVYIAQDTGVYIDGMSHKTRLVCSTRHRWSRAQDTDGGPEGAGPGWAMDTPLQRRKTQMVDQKG